MRIVGKASAVTLAVALVSLGAMVSLPAFGQGQAAGGSGGLQIRVIEGEDGVNIIRQNTAVKPVVEVRDRNNLPVAGAAVQFLLPSSGPGGVFANGQKTVSVVTDAAGRATTSAVRLQGTGAFKIQVNAAFQGQTATTTVSQTNFATVQAATQAGKSVAGTGGPSGAGAGGASSAVAGASSGLSTAVVSGIAAGVGAVGTVAQTKAATGTDCTAPLNTVLSNVDAAQSMCAADTSSAQTQCNRALQNLLDATGKLCACAGPVSAFQAAFAQYGLSVSDLNLLAAEAKQQGLILPAACGY
jgi:hypothetical protein